MRTPNNSIYLILMHPFLITGSNGRGFKSGLQCKLFFNQRIRGHTLITLAWFCLWPEVLTLCTLFLGTKKHVTQCLRGHSITTWTRWGGRGQKMSVFVRAEGIKHFGTVSSLFNHYFYKKLSLYIHIPNIYLESCFEFGPQRIRDLAFVCP